MLFWIILGIVAAVAIVNTVRVARADYFSLGEGLLAGLASLFIGGLLGAIVWFLATLALNPPLERVVKSESTHQLKALGNDSGLKGRMYFLGGGYIEDKRVLNYITQDSSGAIRVERSDAKDSTIYEGSKQATVKVTHADYINGWIAPWPLGDKREYVFNIPTGSVVESYTLDNK